MLKLLLGDPNARKLKRYQPIVSDINLLEEEIAPLSDDDLRRRTAEFRQRLDNAGSLDQAATRCWMSCCRKRLRWCVKPANACWACATSTCS